MKTYTFGEFFCGAGGMSSGAIKAAMSPELAGKVAMKPVWAVDSEIDACISYHNNIHAGNGVLARDTDEGVVPGINGYMQGDHLVLNADVRKVQPKYLHGVHGFLFGFPCNDFSSAGQRKGLDGSFGLLYQQARALLAEHKPLFFVAENVSGLLHANDYGAFARIVDDLKVGGVDDADQSAGYDVVPHLYRFEEYGVPQTRHRIIIVGIRKDVAAMLDRGFLPPKPSGKLVSAREALEKEPIGEWVKNNEEKYISDTVRRRLEHIAPGQNIWDVNNSIPKELRLKETNKTISSIYRVLDENRPAYTVVGNGGGGTHMYHWTKRATTNRERARFQTFDDTFVFHGSMQSVRKQIGMAVPPLGASIIIEALLKTLHGIDYEGVEPNLVKELDPATIEKKRKRAADVRQRKADLEAAAALAAADAEILDFPEPASSAVPDGSEDTVEASERAA
jgi:DNA-methyltransferase (dcm)